MLYITLKRYHLDVLAKFFNFSMLGELEKQTFDRTFASVQRFQHCRNVFQTMSTPCDKEGDYESAIIALCNRSHPRYAVVVPFDTKDSLCAAGILDVVFTGVLLHCTIFIKLFF